MTTLNYLAYGSNLFPPRLAARITILSVAGAITLPGYELRFNKRGADGSGKCNLQACAQAQAHGVVYRIASADKPTLDRIEGVGHGYVVELWRDASLGECFFYRAQASALDDTLRPYDWYHAYVLAGARQHGFPASYIAAIAAVPTQGDDDAARRAENFARLAKDFPAPPPR
jgi:gamma-glutamylcyclotransferase